MKGKKLEIFGTKSAQQAANGPVWIPQIQKPLCLILFWRNQIFPFFSPCSFLSSSFWGNKELDLPVWKVKRWTFFGTKAVSQAANGPIWKPQVQNPFCLIHFWVNPLSHFSHSRIRVRHFIGEAETLLRRVRLKTSTLQLMYQNVKFGFGEALWELSAFFKSCRGVKTRK